MRVPGALPACGLLAGAVTGALLPVPDRTFVVLLVVAWAVCVVAAAAGRGTLVAVSATFGFAVAGGLMAHRASERAIASPIKHLFVTRIENHPRATPPVIVGRLLQDASRTGYGASLDLLVERLVLDGTPIETDGRVRVAVGGSLGHESIAGWRAGRQLRAPIALRRPVSYLNPGVSDQEIALARRGIALLGSVKSATLVEVIAHGSPLDECASAVRGWVRRLLAREVGRWGGQSAAIATAILIGDRAGLGVPLEERLRQAGTYHVIAISGGNIAVLAAAVLLLLRLAGRSPAISAAATILVLLAYGLVVTGGESVARATLAAVIYFAARVIDHRAPGLNLLLVTAGLLLAWEPLSVLDVAFVLTFGATLGILLAAQPIARRLQEGLLRGRASAQLVARLEPAFTLLSATVAAELVLFPIGAWTFSLVTFAGLALNFAAIPLMSVVQIGSLVTVLLSPVPPLACVASFLVHLSASSLVESTRLLDWAPWLARRVPPPAIAVLAVYYVGSLVLLACGSRRVRRAGAAFAATAGVSMLLIPVSLQVSATFSPQVRLANGQTPDTAGRSLRVAFFDVAQGDATLVQFPSGRSLLIDAGSATGSFDVGARVVAPALWALGVSRLDFLTLTHGDADHIGGALAVIRDFQPWEVWEGIHVPALEPMRHVAAAAARGGSEWRRRLAGDFVSTGGAALRVVHPPPPDWERPRVRNDDSVVLELRFGEVSVVLPGDIGRDVEAEIADRLEPARIRVLKAPHHGSRSSSSELFLTSLVPAAVVFSAGRSNLFGHPAPDVVARYRRAGAAIFRTDQDGAILLDTDGREVMVRTMRGRTSRF